MLELQINGHGYVYRTNRPKKRYRLGREPNQRIISTAPANQASGSSITILSYRILRSLALALACPLRVLRPTY